MVDRKNLLTLANCSNCNEEFHYKKVTKTRKLCVDCARERILKQNRAYIKARKNPR